jgi:hypothetical protein
MMSARHDEPTTAGCAPPVAARGATMIEGLLLAVWAAPCLAITAGLFYRSTMLLQRNYNEGWNAFHAAALFHGSPLYYPPSALITNNYPPLSFIVVSWVMHVIPDAVFAGRAVQDAALVSIAALIALCLRATSRDGLASAAGALTFLSYMAVNAELYVGVDDPQFLSLAILLLGFYLKLRLGARSGADIAAGLLMTASLFVKHNNVALPLALGGWLLIFDRKAGLRFIATGVAAGLCGLLAARLAFGPDFITSLLSPRLYAPSLAARQALDWLAPMKPLLVLAAIPIVLAPRDRTALLFGGYVVSAVLIGCIAASGSGTAIIPCSRWLSRHPWRSVASSRRPAGPPLLDISMCAPVSSWPRLSRPCLRLSSIPPRTFCCCLPGWPCSVNARPRRSRPCISSPPSLDQRSVRPRHTATGRGNRSRSIRSTLARRC